MKTMMNVVLALMVLGWSGCGKNVGNSEKSKESVDPSLFTQEYRIEKLRVQVEQKFHVYIVIRDYLKPVGQKFLESELNRLVSSEFLAKDLDRVYVEFCINCPASQLRLEIGNTYNRIDAADGVSTSTEYRLNVPADPTDSELNNLKSSIDTIFGKADQTSALVKVLQKELNLKAVDRSHQDHVVLLSTEKSLTDLDGNLEKVRNILLNRELAAILRETAFRLKFVGETPHTYDQILSVLPSGSEGVDTLSIDVHAPFEAIATEIKTKLP